MVTHRLPIYQGFEHRFPGSLEYRSALLPQLLALRLGSVMDRHTRAFALRRERDFHRRGLIRPGAHVEIERQTVWWFPGQHAAQFHFASIAGALPEAAGPFQEQFTLRIFRQPVSLRPPFGDLRRKQVESLIRRATQEDGFSDHFRDSASRRANAVSQNSSRNSRTGANPFKLMA